MQSDTEQEKNKKKEGPQIKTKKSIICRNAAAAASEKASVQHITASLSSSFKNTKCPLWSLAADYRNKLTIISTSFGFGRNGV